MFSARTSYGYGYHSERGSSSPGQKGIRLASRGRRPSRGSELRTSWPLGRIAQKPSINHINARKKKEKKGIATNKPCVWQTILKITQLRSTAWIGLDVSVGRFELKVCEWRWGGRFLEYHVNYSCQPCWTYNSRAWTATRVSLVTCYYYSPRNARNLVERTQRDLQNYYGLISHVMRIENCRCRCLAM